MQMNKGKTSFSELESMSNRFMHSLYKLSVTKNIEMSNAQKAAEEVQDTLEEEVTP